jgi:biopolymer transport protein TolR
LTDKLTAIAKERPDRQVFIRADEQVPYGEVIRTMAAIKAAGIENVGMVTQPATEAASDSSANQHTSGKPDQ